MRVGIIKFKRNRDRERETENPLAQKPTWKRRKKVVREVQNQNQTCVIILILGFLSGLLVLVYSSEIS